MTLYVTFLLSVVLFYTGTDTFQPEPEHVRVSYTLWVGTNITKNFQICLTTVMGNTFYQAMLDAEKEDPDFRFVSIEHPEFGHYVTCISGYEEDREENMYWMLYELPDMPNPKNPPGCKYISKFGVDYLKVNDSNHYLFWYREVTNHVKV